MAEIIEADIQIIGNLLQVTPKEAIEDNAQYEIRIKDLRSKDGKSAIVCLVSSGSHIPERDLLVRLLLVFEQYLTSLFLLQ